MRIGIDLMGSDTSPKELFPAIINIAKELNNSWVLVVLGKETILEELKVLFCTDLTKEVLGHLDFIYTEDVITMEDSPLTAVRRKKDSSMAVGIRHLAEGLLDALVSAGNTGALIANATMILPRLEGVERLALLAALPTRSGNVAVLDVGAHVSCSPQHMVQYARLGAAYQRCQGIDKPSIGLLNIGAEAKKGTEDIQQAYCSLNDFCDSRKEIFLGNVEGKEVFSGKVDVLVTDGFSGNIFLKATEGTAAFVFDYLRELSVDGLQKVSRSLDYSAFPGALLCGIDGVVVKCHGYSDKRAISNAIRGTIKLLQDDLLGQMKQQL